MHAGIPGDGSVAFDPRTAVGAPMSQDGSQVQYHQEHVGAHSHGLAGHQAVDNGSALDQVEHQQV